MATCGAGFANGVQKVSNQTPTTETPTEMDMYAARCAARKLHKSTAQKLIQWGESDMRYMEVQPSSPLRKNGFVEPMGGGMVRLTVLGQEARKALQNVKA